MDIETLVKLTSRSWSLNILALLHSGVPGRQAPLLAATLRFQNVINQYDTTSHTPEALYRLTEKAVHGRVV